MVKQCVVCGGSFEKGSGVSFHRYPADPDLRDKWCSITGVKGSAAKNYFLCSKHFSPSDFVIKAKGLRYIKKGALPVNAFKKFRLAEQEKKATMNATELNNQVTNSEANANKDLKFRVISTSTILINVSKNDGMMDIESLKGHFGWCNLDEKTCTFLPYLTRYGDKYCSVRMVEAKLSATYMSNLNPEIYASYINVESFYVTEAERKLLNEINALHCDYEFGKYVFMPHDLMVRLEEALEFCKFLYTCYAKLFSPNLVADKCGFISIEGKSVVPYVLYDDEKYFPLFYFEGAEHLQNQAKTLKGWDLAYMKFCYKVQGIRDEFIKQETCMAVSFTDIRECFPPNTEFKDYWPTGTLKRFPANKQNLKPTWYRLPNETFTGNNCVKQVPPTS